MPNLRDDLVRGIYRLGWAGAGRIPPRVARPIFAALSRIVVWRHRKPVRQLRRNLAAATGKPVDDQLARAAIASYLRTFHEVLALPHWSRAKVAGQVRVPDVERLRAVYASRGVVVALPHSGNWDLAGAWACGAGLPVTTVAEQLPDASYSAFVRFRERLGMEVLSHRGTDTVPRLVEAIGRGRVICLIADRDLNQAGVLVDWRGTRVTLPVGPALVARRSGAALIPAVCRYVGREMQIRLGPEIMASEHGPGRAGLTAMTQQVATFFAGEIASQPEDWHMFQPFFAPPPSEVRAEPARDGEG
jgi:phosphatidylinositol dimannoside acyltransferase